MSDKRIGATALIMAAQNGHTDIVNVLLNAGAEKNAIRK